MARRHWRRAGFRRTGRLRDGFDSMVLATCATWADGGDLTVVASGKGLSTRSAGFNDNAKTNAAGEHIKGKIRVSGADRRLCTECLGIRTDLDLRVDFEVWGMDGSPLGPAVRWVRVPTLSYAGFGRPNGIERFKRDFALFLDRQNYPVIFHCIGGADRTGSLTFVLNALLGVDEDELEKDWELTAFNTVNPLFRHCDRYDKLLQVFAAYEGRTINERVLNWALANGVTDSDIRTFREIMLEPKDMVIYFRPPFP